MQTLVRPSTAQVANLSIWRTIMPTERSIEAQSRIEAGWAALVGDASMARARALCSNKSSPLAASRLRCDQPGERPLSGYDAGLAVFAADDAFVVDVSKLHHHLAAWPRPAELSRIPHRKVRARLGLGHGLAPHRTQQYEDLEMVGMTGPMKRAPQ
jgi:hypothetical protein